MRSEVSCAVRRTLLLCLAASAAQAQEQEASPAGGSLEEIVITGSRLLRSRDFQAVSPVQTIDLEQIQSSGNITLEDTLNKFPQLKPDNTGTTNQSGGTGVLSANLRGLGRCANTGPGGRPPLRSGGRHGPGRPRDDS